MDPYDEQRLRNEVIYLHSLWHQGPPPTPHSHPHPPPNPIHLPIQPLRNTTPFSSSHPLPPHFHGHPRHHQHTIHPFPPAHTRSLPPIASTAFKKKNKKKRKKDENNRPPPSLGPEWPCPPPPAPPSTDWAPFKPNLDPPVVSVSPQDKKRFVPLIAQNKACKAFRQFLRFTDDDGDSDSDGNVNDSDDDDDDDGDEDDYDDRLEEFEDFFVRVFMEDNELRKYYQECFENGEFNCLVCGAVEKKKCRKMFKDCIGVVQHSMSILRTANKRAHRGFGQAVCKVLGWDIERLPMIVMKGEPLGCSIEINPDEAEDKSMGPIDGDLGGPSGEKHEESLLEGLRVPMTRSKAKKAKEALEQDGDNVVNAEVCHESLISGAELDDKSANCESSSADCYSSEEEGASVATLQFQQKALEACQEYFANSGSDCDEDNGAEDNDELIDDRDSEECDEFKFFMMLFTDDSDLRRYYESNYKEGEFNCLVCGGMRLNKWKKRFKNCIELLEHSNAVKGTKRKKAHRAYSQVICKVTDIVLKGEPLGSSCTASKTLLGEPQKPTDSHIGNSNVLHEKLAE